jgi:hypothetical protein
VTRIRAKTGQLVAKLTAHAVGHDFDHDIGRLADFPQQVGAIALFGEQRAQAHIQAEQHVGNDRRLVDAGEHTNIRQHHKAALRARPLPRAVERLGQQAHLLLGKDSIHWRVILGDQLIDPCLEFGQVLGAQFELWPLGRAGLGEWLFDCWFCCHWCASAPWGQLAQGLGMWPVFVPGSVLYPDRPARA